MLAGALQLGQVVGNVDDRIQDHVGLENCLVERLLAELARTDEDRVQPARLRAGDIRLEVVSDHPRQLGISVERVERRDLVATVRATGMVLSRRYTNVLGQGYGRVTLAGSKGIQDWKIGADTFFSPVHESLQYAITNPSLFDPGTAMRFLPAAARAVAQGLPRGEYQQLEGGFHEVPAETLAPVIADFIRRAAS